MCNQDISIHNYKVFVFDLDNTLYLHSVDYSYRQEYTQKIKEFLQFLKSEGKILCLATHNRQPYYYLNIMEIYDLFHEVVYEQKDVTPRSHTIYEYTNKKEMLQEIIEKTNTSNEEVIFFDDVHYNLKEVKSLGIETVYVSPYKGINIEKISVKN